jgi:glycine/D-amino acid oxidase-like deaminating enzyme
MLKKKVFFSEEKKQKTFMLLSRTHTRSLYADTAPAAIATPPLMGERRSQVGIVGGGYTGLSTALHLAERGIDATVLEAHEPGWGASGRNGGQVNPGLYPDPATLIARFGEKPGRRMLDFAADAPDRVFDLVRRHRIDCEAEQSGTLRVAFNSAGFARINTTFEQLQQAGAHVVLRDAAALAAETGTARYTGGIFFPRGGKLNPLGYARGMAEAAKNAGATIHGNSPAVSVTRNGAGWHIATPQGSLLCDTLVIATNGYTDDLWPSLRQTLVPVYTTIVASAPLATELARQILPGGQVVYEVGHNTVYYRLDRSGRLLMGGRSIQRDDVTMSHAAHLRGYAVRLWPHLHALEWTHCWNGQVAVTADQMIHLHEPAPNVLICLGYNGRGIAMATSMGGVLASRIAGDDNGPPPIPILQQKPIPFHRFWKTGVQARLFMGRMRDCIG